MAKEKVKKIIKRKYSKYKIMNNDGGRVNKLKINSSEFPQEIWVVKNMKEADKLINFTEDLLRKRQNRLKKNIIKRK